jgi:hypothetical protein
VAFAHVSKERSPSCVRRYVKERNVGGRFLMRFTLAVASKDSSHPSLQSDKQIREEGEKVNVYGLPDTGCRKRCEWE